jgi:hypothetical protein
MPAANCAGEPMAIKLAVCPGRSAATQSSLRNLRKLDCVVVRCRPGTVRDSALPAVPDQRCTASLRFALHRIRDTRFIKRCQQAKVWLVGDGGRNPECVSP